MNKTTTSILRWDVSRDDAALIRQIVARAGHENITNEALRLDMDLTACHLNGTPLDLAQLLVFPRLDFAHDLCGITKHIDRGTGRLTGCFVPRCAAKGDAQ